MISMKFPLHYQVVAGVILGIVVGLIFGEGASLLQPVGDIFLRLLQFLVVPLVVVTLVAGMLQMSSVADLGRVGGRFLAYLVLTALVASSIGVAVALLIRPGLGLDLTQVDAEDLATDQGDHSFVDQFVEWFPSNYVDAMANMSMLQIIIGSLLFGAAILTIGKTEVPTIFRLVDDLSAVVLKLTGFIIALSPIGIFALIAVLVGTTGTETLVAAGKFILADYIGLLIVVLVVYPIVLKLVARVGVLKFYRSAWPATLFAMSTSSSSATIPVSMKVAERNLGAPKSVYGFTIPFGATANMDGFSVALGVISILALDAYGIEITPMIVMQIVLLGLVLSIGAAGVRGAGIVMSAVLMESLGLPLEIIPLLAAVWPIIDVGHTGLNVTSDIVGTTVVSSRGGGLNREVFDSKSAPLDLTTDTGSDSPSDRVQSVDGK